MDIYDIATFHTFTALLGAIVHNYESVITATEFMASQGFGNARHQSKIKRMCIANFGSSFKKALYGFVWIYENDPVRAQVQFEKVSTMLEDNLEKGKFVVIECFI